MIEFTTQKFETEIAKEMYMATVTKMVFDDGEKKVYVCYSVHRTNTGWASLPARARLIKSRIYSKLGKQIEQAVKEMKGE